MLPLPCLRDQSLTMPGRGAGRNLEGLPKILGCERGAAKKLKSDKGDHENYKANLSYLKRKLLPSTIFVKPCISPYIIINEYFHESLGTTFFP